MVAFIRWLEALGSGHDAVANQAWWAEHEEFPMLAVGFYLCVVFNGPKIMARYPFGPVGKQVLKIMFISWNLALSIFSWMGLYYVMPHLIGTVRSKGVFFTICAAPGEWYTTGKPGFWLEMFIMSKFPELLDTVFLVLQQKKVIFLHWYHHCTVLLFCWQAYIRDAGPGLWYCAMNYSVHAVMYLYYAGMAIPSTKRFVSKLALFITTAQIMQMVVGACVTMSAAYWWLTGSNCHLRQSTCCLGVIMYLSYFGLFVTLFVDKYCICKPCGKTPMGDPCMGEISSDSAGMFRSSTKIDMASAGAPAVELKKDR